MADKLKRLVRPWAGLERTYTEYCQKFHSKPDFDVFQTVFQEVAAEKKWEALKKGRRYKMMRSQPKRRGAGGGKDNMWR